MNISRLLPFLPLLMLLPAASVAAPLIPSSATHTNLNPSDLCPLVQIVERELCGNAHNATFKNAFASKLSDLCVLLQNYNASFCSKKVVMAEPLSYDTLSIRMLEKDFLQEAEESDNDIHDLCPIINFIDQELCTSRSKSLSHVIDFQFYPKELCPLLNFTYAELCS